MIGRATPGAEAAGGIEFGGSGATRTGAGVGSGGAVCQGAAISGSSSSGSGPVSGTCGADLTIGRGAAPLFDGGGGGAVVDRVPASPVAAVRGWRHQLHTLGVVLSMPQCLQNIGTILRPVATAASPDKREMIALVVPTLKGTSGTDRKIGRAQFGYRTGHSTQNPIIR